MNKLSLFIIPLLAVVIGSCSQLPPDNYLTPEFESVTIDDSDVTAVRFVCEMSSMTQLTEFGLDYTDKPDDDDSGWVRVYGERVGEDSFEVTLRNLALGTTYRYRLFIGNGRDLRQSSTNYYTTQI